MAAKADAPTAAAPGKQQPAAANGVGPAAVAAPAATQADDAKASMSMYG